MGLDQRAHLGELAEHEHGVAGAKNDVEQLIERLKLPGPARKRPGLVEVLSRMVADLLQHREQPQHEPLALDARLRGDGM